MMINVGPLNQWLQYRHLIPAQVDRTSDGSWLSGIMPQNKPSTPMAHVACESKLRSCCVVIHASMPRKLGGNRACGRVLCPDCQRILWGN